MYHHLLGFTPTAQIICVSEASSTNECVQLGGGDVHAELRERIYRKAPRLRGVGNMGHTELSFFWYQLLQKSKQDLSTLSNGNAGCLKIPAPASKVLYNLSSTSYKPEMQIFSCLLAMEPNPLLSTCMTLSLTVYSETLAIFSPLIAAIQTGKLTHLQDLCVRLPTFCEIADPERAGIYAGLEALYAVLTPENLPNLSQLALVVFSPTNYPVMPLAYAAATTDQPGKAAPSSNAFYSWGKKFKNILYQQPTLEADAVKQIPISLGEDNVLQQGAEKVIRAMLPQLAALTMVIENATAFPEEVNQLLLRGQGKHLRHFAVHTHSHTPSVDSDIQLLTRYIKAGVLPELQCLSIGQPKQDNELPSALRMVSASVLSEQMQALIALFDAASGLPLKEIRLSASTDPGTNAQLLIMIAERRYAHLERIFWYFPPASLDSGEGGYLPIQRALSQLQEMIMANALPVFQSFIVQQNDALASSLPLAQSLQPIIMEFKMALDTWYASKGVK